MVGRMSNELTHVAVGVGAACMRVLQKHDNAMVRHMLELKRPEDAPPPPAGTHQ